MNKQINHHGDVSFYREVFCLNQSVCFLFYEDNPFLKQDTCILYLRSQFLFKTHSRRSYAFNLSLREECGTFVKVREINVLILLQEKRDFVFYTQQIFRLFSIHIWYTSPLEFHSNSEAKRRLLIKFMLIVWKEVSWSTWLTKQ